MADAGYKPAQDIAFQQVGEEIVILDLKAARYFGLNPTAAYIWRCLTSPRQGHSTAEDYAAAFQISLSQARRDFEATTADFVRRRFISSR